MTDSLFIQIHTLTSYPASLLNRDDVGFAKRVPFGEVTRTRISSQCLKRHWRTFQGDHALSGIQQNGKPLDASVRSRLSFDRFVLAPLVTEGMAPDLARAATEAVMVAVLGESAKAKKAKADAENAELAGEPNKGKKGKGDDGEGAPLQTGQITVLGKAELDYFLQEARALAKAAETVAGVEKAIKDRFSKEWTKNLQGLKRAAGLDAALFGRMVTSDRLARADAAVHVAHAFTVHAEQSEPDYFSAVDDLLRNSDTPEQLGSGHIGTTELTTGLFYGYVVVDVPQLVSNLEGGSSKAWKTADRALAAQIVEALVHLVTRVSPGAKAGSTAPYAYAHFAMAEIGRAQPRTLANAFLAPVRIDTRTPDLIANTFAAIKDHVTELDAMYGAETRRSLAALGPKDQLAALGALTSVADVAKFAARAVLEGA